jgi:hypothetical protein
MNTIRNLIIFAVERSDFGASGDAGQYTEGNVAKSP